MPSASSRIVGGEILVFQLRNGVSQMRAPRTKTLVRQGLAHTEWSGRVTSSSKRDRQKELPLPATPHGESARLACCRASSGGAGGGAEIALMSEIAPNLSKRAATAKCGASNVSPCPGANRRHGRSRRSSCPAATPRSEHDWSRLSSLECTVKRVFPARAQFKAFLSKRKEKFPCRCVVLQISVRRHSINL